MARNYETPRLGGSDAFRYSPTRVTLPNKNSEQIQDIDRKDLSAFAARCASRPQRQQNFIRGPQATPSIQK
jgi:hypothetical protein